MINRECGGGRQMIERARTLSRDYGNVEFHVTSFPHHSLPAGRFDAVFSMEVFYYLPDMRAALEETRRLLKPGGRFTCAVDYYGECESGNAAAFHLLSYNAIDWIVRSVVRVLLGANAQ